MRATSKEDTKEVAAGPPPSSTMESIPPKPDMISEATAWSGCPGNPG